METKRPLPMLVSPHQPCGRQPHHVFVHAGNWHYLECSPCEARTHRYQVQDLAIEDWELANAPAGAPAQ